MTPERWERIKELFDGALERPAGEREVFLAEAAAGDAALADEVRRLLAEHSSTADFLEHPLPVAMATLRPGEVLAGRFRIGHLLGRGGMGAVYQAEDLELGETVALKILRPEIAAGHHTVNRFKQEIHLARKVTHPNVCRIFDMGQDGGTVFLTMELVEGETLAQVIGRQGRMTTEEALPLAAQMGAALDAAHRVGIVHRDFKSSNVMLTPGTEGAARIVVTDFGLAQSVGQGDSDSLTVSRYLMGTPAYMAPEQFQNGPVTRAVDLYAFGVVLYEMVTGTVPFRGGLSVLGRWKQPPPSPRRQLPELDENWETAIRACLDPEPQRRPSSAAEVVEQLRGVARRPAPARWRRWAVGAVAAAALLLLVVLARWLAIRPPTAGPPANSIAVLPFESPDRDNQYFSDGMTEELINALTRLQSLRVIARNSAFGVQAREQDPRRIGERLGVRHLLRGTVRQSADRLRVTTQLIDAAEGRYLWSESYDRQGKDLFTIQDDIAQNVARTLGVKLAAAQASRRFTNNLEAYNLYLQGRFHWNKRSREGMRKGLDYFGQALASDPGFALAHSGLADSYSALMDYGFIPAQEAIPRARAAAQKALEIDPALAEAHASLGLISSLDIWDWSQAEPSFRRALELNPGYASAHQWYGVFLRETGRLGAAIERFGLAEQLDPLSVPVQSAKAHNYLLTGRLDEAVAQMRKVEEINPQYIFVHIVYGQVWARRGDCPQALSEARRTNVRTEELPNMAIMVAYLAATCGDRAEALRILAELKAQRGSLPLMASQIAAVYGSLHEADEAFAWLDRAYQERDSLLLHLNSLPFWEELRRDPRYPALRDKVGHRPPR